MQYPPLIEDGIRGVELLRRTGDLWAVADLLGVIQFAQCFLGRLSEVTKIGVELDALAQRLGNHSALQFSARTQGFAKLATTGDLDAFGCFAQSDLEFCRRIGSQFETDSLIFLGLTEFWRGNWESALAHFEEGVALEKLILTSGRTFAPGSGNWIFAALCKAYAGMKDQSVEMFEAKRGDFPSAGRPNTLNAWTVLLGAVEAFAVMGEKKKSAELYPLVREAIETRAVVRYQDYRLLETVAGIAAAAGERWDDAEGHFRAALALAETMPHRLEAADARRFYAQMLIERRRAQDCDLARKLLKEAITGYRQIGMPRHRKMAEALLKQA